MRKIINYNIWLLIILMCWSCDSLLENDLPSNEVIAEDALESANDVQQLLNSTYDVTANVFNGNNQRFSELLADNVTILGNSGFLVQVYNRSTDFFNSDVGGYYGQPYIAILRANTILEGIDDVDLTQDQRDRFEGEAKFLRAINHFALVRHFAQPAGYTADNSHLGIVVKSSAEIKTDVRSSVDAAYDLIIADLEDAVDLLPAQNGNYATTYAAQAYLAKVYFQMNNFAQAAAYASDVIENGPFTFSDDINSRYGTSVSSESIFTLISTGLEDNRAGNFKGMYDSRAAVPTLLVSDDYFSLVNSSGGERSAWVENIGGSKVFTKFNRDYMNVSLTNLTELLLIAAESYAELNQNLSTAIDYVNTIKDRAGVALLSDGSSAGLIISEARKERRIEFGGEGYRLHELKRRGTLGEAVLIRNAPWDCNGMVLQFPASEQAVKGFEMNPEGGCN
ncbi:putative outer membrane protein [Fulvivirga imtechensis AK7]|uniref:Putative outer membrane protein n=1 Tax=Fulvivirga imtechensis AK7 TaxID=1237149 RepID=L8K063_9BACT|nr:RagB/SusD family nutrient uptake outer membrane protein [Fulvivirga imtechensis]ELR73773.1 putative outer membrane protein [Fulvivirga imtechensis AK7]